MNDQVELRVNGKTIPLTDFPDEFIKNTVMGMISSLKGVEKTIQTVSIKITNLE